jgi:hypothetical protein
MQVAMSVALHRPITLAEFLAWEERQELRYEFDGFEPVAMTGGTIAHDQITFNLRKALDARLAGKPCRPLGPNVKIIADGRVRYPDAIVVCRPVAPTATVAADPVVVFEVLSEGSSETDLIDKNREYRATPRSSAMWSCNRPTKRQSCSCGGRTAGCRKSSQGTTPAWICRKSISPCRCMRSMRTRDCPNRHKRERECDVLLRFFTATHMS